MAFDYQCSFASDIYSVGVMLYERVTGELSYHSPFELASGRVIRQPREISANVPTRLEAVILRAMARNPAERYPSCTAMLVDVATVFEELEAGQAPSPPDRVRPSRPSFRLDSSSPLYQLEQAKAFLAADNLSGALSAAEIAVERSGGHPHYLRLLGAIYLRMGYPHKALETYEKALAAYQRDIPAGDRQMRDALERLGDLYIKTQRYREAVRACQQLLAVSDNLPYAKFRLAVAYGLDADYRKAIQMFEEVRRERPDAAVVYSKLGQAYRLEGDFRQAISYFNQALLIDLGDLLSLYELGEYHWIMGDRSTARRCFERVRQNDVKGRYAERVQQLLAPH